MPITQPRLLELLEAAEAYLSLYRQNINLVSYLNTKIRDGLVSPTEAFHDLGLILTQQPVPAKHLNTILTERTRYDLTHSRNARLARQKAQARAGYSPGHAEPRAPNLTLEHPWDADANDEAFDGLAGLADEAHQAPPPADPSLDPAALDPAYLAWKATITSRGHQS